MYDLTRDLLADLIALDPGPEGEPGVQSEYFQGKIGQVIFLNAHGVCGIGEDAETLYVDVAVHALHEDSEYFLVHKVEKPDDDGNCLIKLTDQLSEGSGVMLRVRADQFDAWLLDALKRIGVGIA